MSTHNNNYNNNPIYQSGLRHSSFEFIHIYYTSFKNVTAFLMASPFLFHLHVNF
jgi:hypothetical protein